MNEAAVHFWQDFLTANPHIPADSPYQVWFFGNSAEMAAELAQLVLAGTKTATASLVETNDRFPETSPVPNGYSVVTDHAGTPVCIVQTTEMRITRFRDVAGEFAYDEGEGDRSLEYWRRAHKAYFEAEAAKYDLHFDDNSMICCERFKLLFPK